MSVNNILDKNIVSDMCLEEKVKIYPKSNMFWNLKQTLWQKYAS